MEEEEPDVAYVVEDNFDIYPVGDLIAPAGIHLAAANSVDCDFVNIGVVDLDDATPAADLDE